MNMDGDLHEESLDVLLDVVSPTNGGCSKNPNGTNPLTLVVPDKCD